MSEIEPERINTTKFKKVTDEMPIFRHQGSSCTDTVNYYSRYVYVKIADGQITIAKATVDNNYSDHKVKRGQSVERHQLFDIKFEDIPKNGYRWHGLDQQFIYSSKDVVEWKELEIDLTEY